MAENEKKVREVELTNSSPHTPYGVQTTGGLVDVRPGQTVKVKMFEADADALEEQAKVDAEAQRAGLQPSATARKVVAAREKEEEEQQKAEADRRKAEEESASRAAAERQKAEQPRKA